MFKESGLKKVLWGSAFIILIAAIAVGVMSVTKVFAQSNGPATSGVNVDRPSASASKQNIGDAPDESGYTGSVPQAVGQMPSSGTANYLNNSPAVNQVIGDDPDEPGYTGPQPATSSVAEPSGTGSGIFGSYWMHYFSSPQPDSPVP